MKRVPELRDLSQDHHHGLVLARRARQAAAGEEGHEPSAVWLEVEARFASELEPHFQIEETPIDEHEPLRACVRTGSGRTAADLRRFGELLEQHIRFEEREPFEVAQERLSPEALRAVARACRAHGE